MADQTTDESKGPIETVKSQRELWDKIANQVPPQLFDPYFELTEAQAQFQTYSGGDELFINQSTSASGRVLLTIFVPEQFAKMLDGKSAGEVISKGLDSFLNHGGKLNPNAGLGELFASKDEGGKSLGSHIADLLGLPGDSKVKAGEPEKLASASLLNPVS